MRSAQDSLISIGNAKMVLPLNFVRYAVCLTKLVLPNLIVDFNGSVGPMRTPIEKLVRPAGGHLRSKRSECPYDPFTGSVVHSSRKFARFWKIGRECVKVDRRSSPETIDGLPLIADYPESPSSIREFTEEHATGRVHILVLVDDDVLELRSQFVTDVRMILQKPDRLANQIAEIQSAFVLKTFCVVSVNSCDFERFLGRFEPLSLRLAGSRCQVLC